MKILKEENGACEERASKQAKQSKAKQVPSASWYWTKDCLAINVCNGSPVALRVEAGR
jgi:hypothetical protein